MPVSPRFRKALLPIALASGLAVTMTGQAKELSYGNTDLLATIIGQSLAGRP